MRKWTPDIQYTWLQQINVIYSLPFQCCWRIANEKNSNNIYYLPFYSFVSHIHLVFGRKSSLHQMCAAKFFCTHRHGNKIMLNLFICFLFVSFSTLSWWFSSSCFYGSYIISTYSNSISISCCCRLTCVTHKFLLEHVNNVECWDMRRRMTLGIA